MTTKLHVDIRVPLDRFDLELNFTTEVQTTGVFGPSGCGKTTLLETLAGLRRQARGTVRFGDTLWLGPKTFVRPEHRNIGYVPQDGLLFPHRSVRNNILAAQQRAVRLGVDVQSTFAQVVELLELEHLLERSPKALSGGERQRVALGRALCSGPKLLLLDEPLAALDLRLKRRLLTFLHRIRETFQIPLFLVSHDPTEVLALCDELLILSEGKLTHRGPTRELLTRPDVLTNSGVDHAFTNLFPVTLQERSDHTMRVSVGSAADDAAVNLVVPRSDDEPRLVSVRPQDIMVATSQPTGISARNVIAARIHMMHAFGHLRILIAELHPELPHVAVELTERSCRELELELDGEIYLIIKTAACAVYSA